MKNALQTLVFTLALTSVEAAEWTQWNATGGNGHFYTVTDTQMTWFDAQAEAANLGGYLTSIGSIEELNFIRSTFGRSELFWTGLTTINGDSTFVWVNGEPITFTYFGDHMPDPSQTSCVIINNLNSRGFTRGFFLDTSPADLYRGIVESNTDPNANTPGGPVDPPTNRVPDGGATAVLLGASLLATSLWRRRRGR